MRPIYPVNEVIKMVGKIPGVFEGDPKSQLDDAGTYLAELISDHSRQSGPTISDPAAIGSEPVDVDNDGDSPDSDDGAGEPELGAVFSFTGNDDPEDVLARLAGARGDEYRRQEMLRGIDALGYYLTFHQRSYQWGIYLPLTGIACLAQDVFSKVVSDPLLRIHLAAHVILDHEYFHFAADYALSQIELLHAKPLFWPIANAPRRNELRVLEEELANGRMLRRLLYPPRALTARGAFSALREYTKRQPVGYRDGYRLVGSRHKLEDRILDHAQLAWKLGWDAEPPYGAEIQQLYPWARLYDLRRCPVHLIHDEARFGLGDLGLRFVQVIPGIVEDDRFRRDLRKMGNTVVERWEKTKGKLRQSTQAGGRAADEPGE